MYSCKCEDNYELKEFVV